MNNTTLGDLSQSFLFQRRGVSLRTEVNSLANELASGQVNDVRTVLNGNYSYLTDLEHEMRTTDAYGVAAVEAAQFTDGVQAALERLQLTGAELADDLLHVADSPLDPVSTQGAEIARGQLGLMFSALNTDLAGRNLFSGNATDTAPLLDVDTLLTGLEAAVAGATTPADIRTAAQAWFDDPAGFTATMYQGSDEFASPFHLSRDESVQFGIRADDQAFRSLLMNTALSAITDSPALAYDQATVTALHREGGIALKQNTDEIVGLQARVGSVQERIEQLTVRNASEASALEFARTDLLSVDPFETATRLEDVRFQLESLYTVTARLSDLALVNFVR